jgi:hypothetical protein
VFLPFVSLLQVNNCVAIFNQKYFILFLIYTLLCCICCGVALIARFISCTNNLKGCSVSGLQAVLCILNFIEAIIFGLFCAIMLFDQLSAIFENTPGIDALQNKKGVARGKYESLKEVFGEPFNYKWWLPLNLPSRMYQDFEHELTLEYDDELQHDGTEFYTRISSPRPSVGNSTLGSQPLLQHQYGVGSIPDPRTAAQMAREAAIQAQLAMQYESAAGGGTRAAGAPESIADALHSRGNKNLPVVFPDGYDPSLYRDSDIPASLAGLQSPANSPPRSPLHTAHNASLEGLKARSTAHS